MASIGSVSCDFVHGRPPELVTRYETWQSPGQDGYGAQALGKGHGAFAVEAVKIDTASNVDDWIDDLRAVVDAKAAVTITNSRDEAYGNCLVMRVRFANENRPVLPVIVPGESYDSRCSVIVEGVRTA